ncbi:MAG: acyl-ACP--UDP-N-acetylglucosamine O-acyltransferase [Rikenellaceae bacterium]
MISDRAFVHPDAKLGAGVTVEPFAYIAADVVIGDDCWIGPGAVIHDGARIGKGCKIHTAASVSCLPQDLKFDGEYTTTEIGDYNDIRECVTISRGTASKGKTVVGDHNLLMAYVHIAHDDVVGSHCVIANRVSLAGEVEVGDWSVIGGHVAIHQWVKVGAHSMIRGGSLIAKDIPPFATVGGEPVRFFAVNRLGLSRRGFSAEEITQIHEASRILFQSGLDYMSGCDKVEAEIPQSASRDLLVGFVRGSQRGVCKPAAVSE